MPFERVLFGLGIRYVGETVAKKLAKHYKNIDTLLKMPAEPDKSSIDLFADVSSAADKKMEELTAVPEIGGKVSHNRS
ncbi:DNA ligase [Nonlabens ulvanivorans]|nr:DNA ligase [Nonlabens ulvanivorans]